MRPIFPSMIVLKILNKKTTGDAGYFEFVDNSGVIYYLAI